MLCEHPPTTMSIKLYRARPTKLAGEERYRLKTCLAAAVNRLVERLDINLTDIADRTNLSISDIYSVTGTKDIVSPKRLLVGLRDLLRFHGCWTNELEHWLRQCRKLKHNSSL